MSTQRTKTMLKGGHFVKMMESTSGEMFYSKNNKKKTNKWRSVIL